MPDQFSGSIESSIWGLKRDLKTAVSAPRINTDLHRNRSRSLTSGCVYYYLSILKYKESIMAKGQQRKNKEAKKPKKKPTPTI